LASYATLTEARNAVGGHVRIVLELTLRDTAGHRPTGDLWTDPRILHLCGAEPFLRDSSATTGFVYYEPVVKSWGVVSHRCDLREAFGSIADTQIVLHDKRISNQLDNSDYVFSTGSAAEAPEITGDDVRLSQLLQFYNWLSATVEIKILFFSDTSTDQATAANFLEDTLFKGRVEHVTVDAESKEIVLDITQDQAWQETVLPGRLLTDSFEKGLRPYRMPIVYGNLHDIFGATYNDEANGLAIQDAIPAGLFSGTLAPALPFYDFEVLGLRGLVYAFNDAKGFNDGWLNQDNFTPNSANRGLYLYHSGAGVWTQLFIGSNPGETNWSGTDPTEELALTANTYLKGDSYVPCSGVEASNGLTNPLNATDGDPFTFAELDLSSTSNYATFLIKSVPPIGRLDFVDDAIRAAVVVKGGNAVTAGATVKFGPYRINTSTPAYFTGTGGVDANGVITESGGTFATDLHDQATSNPNPIAKETYIRQPSASPARSGFVEPVVNWQWQATEDYGNEVGDLVIRVEVTTAGGAGEVLQIVGVGLMYRNVPGASNLLGRSNRGLFLGQFGSVTVRKAAPEKNPSVTFAPTLPEEIAQTIWVLQPKTTVDDASGTITGGSNDPIRFPAHIPAHLMLKWVPGFTTSNVNLSSAAVADGANFGSAWWANNTLDDWAMGEVMEAQLFISGDTTLRDVLNAYVSQLPLMLYRDVADDKVYIICYPYAPDPDLNAYYNGTNRVYFHPNIDHPAATDLNKPYVLKRFVPDMTPRSELFNRFRVRYRYNGPTGEMVQEQIVTEDPGESTVWNPATMRNDGEPSDVVADAGYDPSAVCATSIERYGVNPFPTIEAPSLHDHVAAFGLLGFLIKRHAQPRIIVKATVGTEAYNLKLGHIVAFSEDVNLKAHLIDYAAQGAKTTGWKYGTSPVTNPPADFIVTSVQKRIHDTGLDVDFECEQIIYTPQGGWWTPDDDLSANLIEHLRAKDIVGVADGAELSTWPANVGTDGTETGANRPGYIASDDEIEKPCVNWDGTNALGLILTGLTNVAADYTVFMVVRSDDATAAASRLYFDTTTGRWFVTQTHTASTNIYHYDGTYQNHGTPTTTGWQILVWTLKASGSSSFWRNGVQLSTGIAWTQLAIGGTTRLGSGVGGGSKLDGRIAEFGILNATYDDDTIKKLVGYLAHEQNSETLLASTFPYRFAPPTKG
jgi:hypothetical protein